jgi:DNA-binding NarL/FixJ family response regulator
VTTHPRIRKFRIVSVPEVLWPRFQRLVDQAALVLEAVPCGPSQRERYELVRHPRRSVPTGAPLSRRQMQVLDCMSEGMSDPEIAATMGLGVDTVKSHAQAIFRNLGASGRTNAVLLACRAGLLS